MHSMLAEAVPSVREHPCKSRQGTPAGVPSSSRPSGADETTMPGFDRHAQEKLKQALKAEAKWLGFDACGISKAEPLDEEARHLEQWAAHETGDPAGGTARSRQKDA